jgi:aspartyl-tRNA(Asn)/glutamyl-tRNA(Gln) amidotransferase subunit B
MNVENIDISKFKERVSPERLSELILVEHNGLINAPTAKSVLEEMFKTGKGADEIIAEKGLGQISDRRQLEEAVGEVIKSNARPVADFKAGKEPALKFLVGQVMRATKGRANPALVSEILKKKLGEG